MIFMVIIQLLAQKYESTDGAAAATAVYSNEYIEENVWIVFFTSRCRKYIVVIVLLEVVLEGNICTNARR